jgi:hypothetical protein
MVTEGHNMTIFFPDVSSYTPNVDPAAYPILLARATLSSTVTDTSYTTFKARAAAAGTFFVAYHWLNHGNLAAQARHCYSVVGPDVAVMIDAEDEAGNTGYNGPLTVADLIGFASAYRALGGTVSLCYLPFWYWSGAMSAPSLTPLNTAGLHLVSSNYPSNGYTENGPGWAPYGGVTPVQWQYTSTPIDMNAYRGTVADYTEMVGVPMALTDDDVNRVALASAQNAARAVLLAGKTYIQGFPQPPATELADFDLTATVKQIASDVSTPPPVNLTDADRQAIIDGIVSQLGGKIDEIIAKLNAAGKGFQS